jgi:predicted AlkP superfamily pyrophosphatase or phosphodiesterase
MSRVLLALIDGMRPDALEIIKHPFYRELLNTSSYSLRMRSVMPSVTLPCHMSLFHSVSADRHGILSNTYVPQVRPVNGICEVLKNFGKKSAFFYSWEPLRDLARPLSIARADFICGRDYTFAVADKIITKRVLNMIEENDMPDFTFFYHCWADEAGHKYGWMSDEYLQSVSDSLDNLQQVARVLSDDVKLIVTADHGGHDRTHGSDAPEDMTIPVFFRGQGIPPGKIDKDLCIIDIAPTVTNWLGVMSDPDWEGTSVF